MIITEHIEVNRRVLESGGFSDVRCGRYMGCLVAVKRLRIAEHDNFVEIRKVSINDISSAARDTVSNIPLQRFCKMVILWGTLSHPNVLKFTGVRGDMEEPQFTTVSEWMAHGNIMDYIKHHYVNRLELVCDLTSPAAPFTKMQK